jgi:hypothetical protein
MEITQLFIKNASKRATRQMQNSLSEENRVRKSGFAVRYSKISPEKSIFAAGISDLHSGQVAFPSGKTCYDFERLPQLRTRQNRFRWSKPNNATPRRHTLQLNILMRFETK